MNVGTLTKYVELQTPNRVDDAQGGHDVYWEHFAYLWAHVEPTSGSRRWEAASVVQGVSHVITTHYVEGFKADMRFKLGERVFVVRGVTNVGEKDKELQWSCEEVTE